MKTIFTLVSSKALSFLLRKKHYCPICDSYNSFNSYGVKPRSDAECSKCGSLERHRFIYYFLQKERLLDKSNIKVLHVSPEQCFMDKFEAKWGDNYITGDLYNTSYKVILDVTKIQFTNNYFDLILCNHVMEHVPDDAAAYKEFYRVLKKGGRAIITVPIEGNKTYEDFSITTPEGRLAAFRQEDHVRIYGTDIMKRIKKPGFKVKLVKPADILTLPERKKASLTKNTTGVIFYAKKM